MYCPKCRAEYIEEITRCPTCDADLVDRLAPEIKAEQKSYLKLATVLLIAGISLNFLLRIFGTIVPRMFALFPAPLFANILFLAAGLTAVFFFTRFYKEYSPGKSEVLKNATSWAIAGVLAMVVVHLRNILVVYNFHPRLSLQLQSLQYMDAVIPWLASITILVFSAAFLRETRVTGQANLRRPALYFVLGSATGCLWLTFVMLNYLVSGWLFQYNKFLLLALISLPIVAFGFAASLYFYISFYRIELQN